MPDISKIAENNKPTIATVGMFDGVHLGHRQIVRRLVQEGMARGLEPLVVTFSVHPRIVLGAESDDFRLLSTRSERMSLLKEMGVSNIAEISFTPETARLSACQFLQTYLHDQLHAKALLLGYDNMFGNKQHNDFDQLPQLASNLDIELLNDSAVLYDGLAVSSTQIRRALASGNIALANAMLGYPYAVSGKVVPGRGVGHTLGFPTANVSLTDPRKALPADGVYVVEASVSGQHFRGMANIGACPTFGIENASIEVNLLDFEGNLYDREITLAFMRRLRDVRHFDSSQELMCQLEIDRKEALQ